MAVKTGEYAASNTLWAGMQFIFQCFTVFSVRSHCHQLRLIGQTRNHRVRLLLQLLKHPEVELVHFFHRVNSVDRFQPNECLSMIAKPDLLIVAEDVRLGQVSIRHR